MNEDLKNTLKGIRINRTLDGLHVDGSDPAASAPKRRRRTAGAEAKASAAAAATDPGIAERASRKRLHSDPYLWGLYLVYLVYSIVELYSASSSEIKGQKVFEPLIQHAIYLILGFVVILVMSNIHYKYYRKTAWAFGVIAVLLMIWSFFGGVVLNGAQRAVRIAGFTIQPPEIAKLALVVLLAKVISKNQMRHGITNTGMFISLAITALFCLLLIKNGLTNTILIGLTALSMLVIGGLQMKKIAILFIVVGVVGGIFGYKKFFGGEEPASGTATEATAAGVNPTAVSAVPITRESARIDRTNLRKDRITNYLEGVHPDDKITDENRQVIFSKIAQAHGGVIGNGPGNSRENARLPLAFSDYIFSIIIEDTGLVGGLALLVFYLCLVGRAGRIAVKCRKAFPALLIMGCAVMIVLQALVHMSIVVGIAPVSGQPLPFISKGGTSVIVMSAAMGMMLSVSKFAVQSGRKQEQHTALREAVADTEETDNPTMMQAPVDMQGRPLTYN